MVVVVVVVVVVVGGDDRCGNTLLVSTRGWDAPEAPVSVCRCAEARGENSRDAATRRCRLGGCEVGVTGGGDMVRALDMGRVMEGAVAGWYGMPWVFG